LLRRYGLGPAGDIVVDGDPAPPSRKVTKRGTTAPNFSTYAYCDQTVGWIKMPLGMEVDLGPGDIIRGPNSPRKGAHTTPTFRPMSIVVKLMQVCRILLDTKIGFRPGDIVVDGDCSSPTKGAEHPPPNFSAHDYCGQTVGGIKVLLGTEVGLGPGDIVL